MAMTLCSLLTFSFGILIYSVSSQSVILGTCAENEYQCDDGTCIPKIWQCDYEIDCVNGEDETYDQYGNECVPCDQRGYVCHDDTNKCIPIQWKCDGWTDCPKGDDELYCTECTDDQYQCLDGQCIDRNSLCDHNQDCWNGEDELLDIEGNECQLQIPDVTGTATLSPSITPNDDTASPTISDDTDTDTEDEDVPVVNVPVDDSPTWKYCPSDIVWLGFVNTFEDKNTTKVYWIEPRVREEGKYYEKYSEYHSGDEFNVGLHSVEYIGKKINDNNNTNNTITDDPIFCHLQVLVLDGMRDYQISNCESQSVDDYLEWELVVDDTNYEIAYFSLHDFDIDIERARFVPQPNKYHTDCYAQISFQSGILTQDEEQVVIEETVSWVVQHLWALIGLIVGIVLLFCIMMIVIIILWRKHVEMREYIRADSIDKDEELDHDDIDDEFSHPFTSVINSQANMLNMHRSSTLDLEITTPGGSGGYGTQRANGITPSHGSRTQFEYNQTHLMNNGINNNNVNDTKQQGMNEVITEHVDMSSGTDSSDDDDDGNDILKKAKVESKTRRASILGITAEQLKLIQDKETEKKLDNDAAELLNAEWDRESEKSQNL